jgi:D-glutamate N-acetyltransferase
VNAVHELRKPYLLMIGDIENPVNAKTAMGLKDWVPEACFGQLRFTAGAVDLGLPDLSLREAAARGAKTLVIGIAPPGGQLPSSWHASLIEALEAGLDLAAGLHQRIKGIPEIAACAARLGRKIHDVRHCDTQLPLGSGLPRAGRRLLTVGTDCVVGKKYTALAVARGMAARGHRVDFRATGQTGILISGRGIAVDAVASDFLSGAAETLSPANAPEHWDIIEGQGSLFHPAYAAVTLGLVLGSQPDALVLCHDLARKTLASFPHVPVMRLERALPAYLDAAHLTNPRARFIGVALNTSSLSGEEAKAALDRTADRLDLPCVDPIRTGVESLLRALEGFDAG